VTPGEAFSVLGLDPRSATPSAVRARRRKLSIVHHPDAGGDAAAMAHVNSAADIALAHLESIASATASTEAHRKRSRIEKDQPSFVIELLPVEAFECLLVVTSWLGEVVDEEPPYLLEVKLSEPMSAWCRLELVPDAGSTTVTLTIDAETRSVDVEQIRDLWVSNLNELSREDDEEYRRRPS
jgi:hypothetical protein